MLRRVCRAQTASFTHRHLGCFGSARVIAACLVFPLSLNHKPTCKNTALRFQFCCEVASNLPFSCSPLRIIQEQKENVYHPFSIFYFPLFNSHIAFFFSKCLSHINTLCFFPSPFSPNEKKHTPSQER